MVFTTERRAALAFACLLLLLGAGAWAWFVWSSARASTYEIRTGDAVSGLIRGAPVEFHGVEVGHVSRIDLLGPASVRIRIEVDPKTPVSSSTVATVDTRGLSARGFTGYVYVSLDDKGPPGAPLARTAEGPPVIAAAPSQSASLDTIVMDMNRAVQSTYALLRASFDPETVASLQQTARSVRQLTDTLAADRARLEAVLAGAEATTRRLPPLLDRATSLASRLETQALPRTLVTLEAVDRASGSISGRMEHLLGSMQQAGSRMEPLLLAGSEVAGSLQSDLLPQAERTLQRLERLAATLDDTATHLRRDPSMLLRGAPPPTPGPGEAR
ncbi:MCE family protein [Ramlibacter henchirensis]|uniref:MCE family protein n=1 Tax=Ramlibacter henchirensis TaxID=204072 RepID=A0A4Z0C4W1_9BURK|nr:MlaD family protein [Ramlibacter henchirensis]TFZ05490.1 MCE family protein [Ramlibacter henchirensis]